MSSRAYFYVTPSPSLSPRAHFLSPRALFFVAPSGSEGSLGTCVPREDKKESVLRDDTVEGCRPEPFSVTPSPLFVTPSESEGSLGTCVPREDKKESVLRDDILGRRPEGSEGCLATARQDNKKDDR